MRHCYRRGNTVSFRNCVYLYIQVLLRTMNNVQIILFCNENERSEVPGSIPGAAKEIAAPV
jgi:hypothetical protein